MSLHYVWWIIALLLIGGEVLVPGFFLLWIGIAAAAMGLLLLVFPDLGMLGQALAFSALTFASCMFWWHGLRPRMMRGDDPSSANLSRRGAQMIGRHYVLAEAIVNGRGKAHVGDSLWLVEGTDAPAGSEVEVIGIEGALLKVKLTEAINPS